MEAGLSMLFLKERGLNPSKFNPTTWDNLIDPTKKDNCGGQLSCQSIVHSYFLIQRVSQYGTVDSSGAGWQYEDNDWPKRNPVFLHSKQQ